MNEELECIVLIVLLSFLMILYCLFVIFDEHKKMKYYDTILFYETDWDKYNTILKKQRKIIFRKIIYLYYLKILVKLKGLFRWKK